MKIEYLGHSSFKLTASTGTSVVCDPYDASLGYDMPKVSADAVTVSHDHHDHNNVSAVGGKPVILDTECSRNLNGVEINTTRSFHDEFKGRRRGENLIFSFRIDGVNVCHLGDLGEPCSAELVYKLLPVNVLLIPVGGRYTIDAKEAKKYVDRIKPDVVIPMHFKSKGCNLDIANVGEFTGLFDGECVEELDGNSIELTTDDLDGKTRVIVLRRR